MNRKRTIGIMLAAVAVLVGWDIFVAATPEEGDTISEILLDWSRTTPIISFGLGVVSGHLFWPQKAKGEKK